MYVINFEAEIAGKKFNRIADVEVIASMKSTGKTAILKMPTTALLVRNDELGTEVETAKTFMVGDQVVIRFGYDGNLREEFRGFVRRIMPTTPLEIECEDAAYLLRRKLLQASFRNITLDQLLTFILADTGVEVVNEVPVLNFRKYAFRNVNADEALADLRKKYGLTIYFRNYGQLVVGLASETDGTIVRYAIARNVIDHSLEWEDEENVRLKVKAIAVSRNNEFTEAEAGGPDGDQRTIYFYDLAPGENLKERAEQEILKYRYSGYRGELTGFLLPICEPGNTARLTDGNFENREGDYLVEKVTSSISQNGGRRKVTLGLKLN